MKLELYEVIKAVADSGFNIRPELRGYIGRGTKKEWILNELGYPGSGKFMHIGFLFLKHHLLNHIGNLQLKAFNIASKHT